MNGSNEKNLLQKLKHGEELSTALIVLAVMVLLFVNVMLRKFFHASFSWAEEMIRYVLIWITFIGAAIAFRNESHFGVDLIFRIKNVQFVKIVHLINDIGCFVFCGFVAYYGTQMVLFNMGSAQCSPALQIPLWEVYLIIPISAVVSMLYIVRNFIRKLKTPADVLHEINNTHREQEEPIA